MNSFRKYHRLEKLIELNEYLAGICHCKPMSVAARSKVHVCGRSPAELVGSNGAEVMDVCFLLVLCVVR
jgi:hypothetical protein